MSKNTLAPSRRTLLSAAALLGGGAALSSALTPAAATSLPRATAANDAAARTGLYVAADPSREIWGFSEREPAYGVNRWGSTHPGSTTVDRAANVLYGGDGPLHERSGLTATNIDTGKIDASIPEQGLGPVWGMAVVGKTLFFAAGSDGTTIYAHQTVSPVSDPLSYKKLGVTDQVRSNAWTATGTHAVFGAAPAGIGYDGTAPAGSTGVVGIFNAATQRMSTRLDLFPGHYVSHLASIGSTVFGATRPAADNSDGAAAPILFALDPAAGTVLRRQEMPGVHFTGLAVLEGLLYVATADEVLEVDPATGATVRTFALPKPDTNRNPRYFSFLALPHAKRLLHQNSLGQSVIPTRTGVVTPARKRIHTSHFTDARNTVWVHKDGGHGPLKMDHSMADGAPYRGPWISPFVDVATTRVFYKEIAWLAEAEISGGWNTPSGRQYRPNAKVTREIMAAFLYRLAGSPEYTAPATSPFADVATSRAFYLHMSWLAEQKISTGWAGPNGTRLYKPDQDALRDQMAAFRYRLAGSPEYTAPAKSPFTDVSTRHVFYKEIAWLAHMGVSNGWAAAGGTRIFGPGRPVLRDQMAAFMYRLAATTL
ncbi:S-layer homology domain-containing protein [Kocuria sp. CPCC 205263]|uniref:S-layer homology domain-containing protein n=1 Tax=Kocuria sp. CPCC 205263 TaxID=3073555 RepID=UPI0034D59A2F